MDILKGLLERIPDNWLLALFVFLLALVAAALLVAIKQGRELSLWPPRLGPIPDTGKDAVPCGKKYGVCEPLSIIPYGSVNWLEILEKTEHTFKASGFALVKIVELNSRRLLRKIQNNNSFYAEIYLGDPFSPATAMRVEDEDDNYLAPQIIARVAIQIMNTQKTLKEKGQDSKLVLKHFSCYPTMAVIIADDDLYVYFYPFGKLGSDSPVIKFHDYKKHSMADFFVEHFEALSAASYEISRVKLESLLGDLVKQR